MVPPSALLPQGSRVGDDRYELQHYLGHGHFGEVWRARDRDLDETIALKLFQPNVDFDAVVDEARLQNLSHHDHVVAVRNVVISGPLPFIIMEYLAAGSVEARLEAGDVSLTDAARWTRGALDGLHHAHSRDVIHRDIKPANILLRANGTAALSDFGLAEQTVARLSRDTYVPHAAPEILQQRPSSVHSDLWAMGCTLYRLVTSQHPFPGPDEVLAGHFTPAHRLNPQVPSRLSRVIDHALQSDPDQRYANAAAMVAALADCNVRFSWTRLNDDDWQMLGGPRGDYRLSLRQADPLRFELLGLCDRHTGAGYRRFWRTEHRTAAEARRILRRLLVQAVEGNHPGPK